jgi:hypothetical protein
MKYRLHVYKRSRNQLQKKKKSILLLERWQDHIY